MNEFPVPATIRHLTLTLYREWVYVKNPGARKAYFTVRFMSPEFYELLRFLFRSGWKVSRATWIQNIRVFITKVEHRLYFYGGCRFIRGDVNGENTV